MVYFLLCKLFQIYGILKNNLDIQMARIHNFYTKRSMKDRLSPQDQMSHPVSNSAHMRSFEDSKINPNHSK